MAILKNKNRYVLNLFGWGNKYGCGNIVVLGYILRQYQIGSNNRKGNEFNGAIKLKIGFKFFLTFFFFFR